MFGVYWLLGLGEEAKIDVAILHFQVTPMLSTKYRVNWPRDVG